MADTKLAERCADHELDGNLRDRFQRLAADWKRDRAPHSSSARLTDHPAYKAIIDLGPNVVPLLLQELEREPDHWFRALHALTGADPVPEESRGKLREMAAAWLTWGREHGYRSCDAFDTSYASLRH
jgi:hypothetical protein